MNNEQSHHRHRHKHNDTAHTTPPTKKNNNNKKETLKEIFITNKRNERQTMSVHRKQETNVSTRIEKLT